MCDTLLLAEISEAFRQKSLNKFDIGPTCFISRQGFAYSEFLTETKVSYKYMTNPEIFNMPSSNLRDGYSFCSQRYEESTLFKSSVFGDDYQSMSDDQHLIYIDANNL